MARYDDYNYGNGYGYEYTRQNVPKDRQTEINEAIMAGERALEALKLAQNDLGTARIAGVVDLFGGGLITNLIKHSKIDDAKRDIENAKYELRNFSNELDDVQDLQYMNIDIDGFLSFADFFFDGVIADFFVQSKINEARSQVAEAIRRVEEIIRRLRTM
jgi:hypothetical protein